MEKTTYDVMERLKKTNWNVRIATPRPFGPGRTRLLDIDAQSRDFPYQGRFGWRTAPSLRKHLRQIAPPSVPIWLTGTDACSLLAMRPLPNRKILGHHYHHFENRLSAIRWWLFYQLLCRQLNCIFYPAEFTRAEAGRIAPWIEKKTRVVRLPFEVAFSSDEAVVRQRKTAKENFGFSENDFVIGNAGWFIKRKRWDVFLQTAKIVSDRVPNARFVLCGGGPEEDSIRRLGASLGISDKLTFTGWVKDMTPYYRAWDVCLFNSDFDAFGCAPIEAACAGAAIVASVKNGGLGEFVDSGKNGILLRIHEPQKLADAIVALAKNPDLAANWRTEAARTIRSLHSPEMIMRSFEQVLFPS